VAVDGSGNIVAAGVSAGTSVNWVTFKLDRLGNRLFGPVALDRHAAAAEAPNDVVLGSDGAAFVVGAAGPGPASDPAATQATTVRYQVDGSAAWLAANPASASAVDAAIGRNGTVYVLGSPSQTLLHYAAAAVNQAPLGALVVATTSGLTVTFDASGSTDADGTIASYRWTFGDGQTATTATPAATHVYASAGGYAVTVTPVDNLGLAGTTASATVSVTDPLAAATPTSVSLSSSSVRGGSSVSGRVSMSTPSGAVVILTSSNPAVASVPSKITVAAGSLTGRFSVTTKRVASTTPVTITATSNGRSVGTTLSVTR
jgi:PKD domain